MLKIFNGKNPLIGILYPIIAFLFLYFYPNISLIKQNIPNYPFIYVKFINLFGIYFTYFYIGFGTLFLSGSAIFFNFVLRKTKLIQLYNNIGGLMFLLLFGTFSKYFDILQISIATSFFLLSLWYIIGSLRKTYAVFDFFNAGFALALASFFWLPAIWFFMIIIFGLLIFRNFNIREFLTSVIGFLLPWFFLFSIWFFIHTNFKITIETYNLLFFKTFPLALSTKFKIISVSLIIILFFVAFQTLRNYRSKESDIQNYYIFFILIALTSGLLTFFFRNFDFSFIIIVLLSFSIPLSIWLSENSNRITAEIFFDVFLLIVIFSQIQLF